MYKPDIQQGNIVAQDMVDKLQPGMSRRQVRFLLGTPMLVDVFHQQRWDYVYTIKEGSSAMVEKRLSLFFEQDRLARMEGDFRPLPPSDQAGDLNRETVVSVPDNDADKGIFGRAMQSVGISSDD